MSDIKSGEEFLKEFFENIADIPDIDKKLAESLKELYIKNKFTETNIKNMIDKLIKEAMNED